MSSKGSKTEQNLKDAFAGESQAYRRYLYFENKDDIEDQNDVAAWFRSTADGEVHGVEKEAYWSVIDLCYLCDLNFMTKCPFVPPHPWQMDFPHLMLRAKAIKFSAGLEGEVRPTHRKPANATHWWR